MFAAWERGDFGSVEWAHPRIEYVIVDGPSPGQWTGLAGMARGWREVMNAYHGIRVEIEECRELDDERVLVLVRFAGRGRTSGLGIDHVRAIGATLFRVRHGKVTRIVNYVDRDRALADLGLAPEGG
jgi:ketosteroid isomerase-like protein